MHYFPSPERRIKFLRLPGIYVSSLNADTHDITFLR